MVHGGPSRAEPASRRPVPRPVSAGQRIRELAAGDEATCALYSNGTVTCWTVPDNRTHVLVGSPDPTAPRPIPGVTGAVAIAVGGDHACTLDAEGRASCWGYGEHSYERGKGAALVPAATRIPNIPPLRAIAATTVDDRTCGIGIADEELHCWGGVATGWFGASGQRDIQPVPSGGLGAGTAAEYRGAVALTIAQASQCARYDDDSARCWSDHVSDGEGKHLASLDAPPGRVRFMTRSHFQQCFVLRSGDVECHSTDGVLRPELARPARTVAASAHVVCATGEDGSLVCAVFRWPDRRADGAALPEYERLERDLGGPVRSVVAGTFSFCALREDDAVFCWAGYGRGEIERIPLP